MKLLIVDDSLVMRNAVARVAGSSAAAAAEVSASEISQVLRAENGREAVAIFAAERPELITMDLTMPELDGLGAIAAIRGLEPRASILVISALNSHRTALEAIRRGACGFLTKPFTDREVAAALQDLIAHARGTSI